MKLKLRFVKKRRTLVIVIGVTVAIYFGLIIKDIATNATYSDPTASEAGMKNVSIFINSQSFTDDSQSDSVSLNSFEPLPHYRDFVQALSSRADSDRYIILVMSDEAYVDMAINFYEASLVPHHVDNFLFVGVGRKTCEILANLSIPCFYFADDPSANKVSSYGQQAFKRKMNIRTDMILEALAANFTVIHSDTDIAFLDDPVKYVKVNAFVSFVCSFVGWRL